MLTRNTIKLALAGVIAASLLATSASTEAATLLASDANLPTGDLSSISAITLPSSGVISAAQGVAFDPDGNIIVAYYGGALNRYSSTGTFLANLANEGDGNGGVAVDFAGNIYMSHGSQVKKYASDGTPLSAITLTVPLGLAVDSSGNLYVADPATGTVEKYAPGGTHLLTFNATVNETVNVAVDALNQVYVSNYNVHTITKFAADGTNLGTFGSGFSNPWGMAFTDSGNLLVANRGNNTVTELSSAGALLNTYSTASSIPTYLATSITVAVPEPSAFGMVILGAFGLAVLRRRR
jgi:glucose/arabinose dehydrogenase